MVTPATTVVAVIFFSLCTVYIPSSNAIHHAVDAPVATTTPVSGPAAWRQNCSAETSSKHRLNDVKLKWKLMNRHHDLQGSKAKDSGSYNNIGGNQKPTNCSNKTVPEVQVTKPADYITWKTNVIIACTVAAAIEIVIVLIIVLKWREIRWTLRKLTCPCFDGRHGAHEPMERQRETPEDGGGEEDQQEGVSYVENDDGRPVQTYTAPTRSREQTSEDMPAQTSIV